MEKGLILTSWDKYYKECTKEKGKLWKQTERYAMKRLQPRSVPKTI